MSLYFYTQPVENSLFNDVFGDDLFDCLVPRTTFGYPCHGRRICHRNQFRNLENQLNKIFNDDNFKLVNFAPKINLSEDEKNYYIHADLPGLTKDQVKMELNEDRILTISGEREFIYNNDDEKNEKEQEQKNVQENVQKQENEEEQQNISTETTGTTENNEMETEPTGEKQETDETTENKNEKETRQYRIKECSYGTFSRSFQIPEDANIENIQAKMENGVLEVIINKIETPKNQNRTIQIQ